MIGRGFMRFGYTQVLLALGMVALLSACDNLNDEAAPIVPSNIGTVTVGWTPPVARVNGDPLSVSEIGGYRVYFGLVPGDYPNKVTIIDGTAQQGTVTAERGLYYYVITSFDTAGRESDFSAVFEIKI